MNSIVRYNVLQVLSLAEGPLSIMEITVRAGADVDTIEEILIDGLRVGTTKTGGLAWELTAAGHAWAIAERNDQRLARMEVDLNAIKEKTT